MCTPELKIGNSSHLAEKETRGGVRSMAKDTTTTTTAWTAGKQICVFLL